MKKTLLALGMIFVFNAYGDIEYSSNEPGKATPQEISRNRACFEELKQNGCGDPGEDVQHFRSCLSNVFSTLTDDCKKMMNNLYGVK